jgi:DNA-binding transcriptional MerR regulator
VRADAFLTPADAARRLGVSAEALRLYEERGLLTPGRTLAGWRAYGPVEMERAAEIVALRALGFGLDQVARVLGGDAHGLEPALATHPAMLEAGLRETSAVVERIRALRTSLASGHAPSVADLSRLHEAQARVSFDLPWPWGGERFEMGDTRAVTWIIGPIGSGKTRLAERIAETIPGGVFIGLDRATAVQAQLAGDMALRDRVAVALAWLIEDGATGSDDLLVLLVALESSGLWCSILSNRGWTRRHNLRWLRISSAAVPAHGRSSR